MKWIAYCKTCDKLINECQNGMIAENYARLHVEGKDVYDAGNLIKGGLNHQVIVGYFIK